MLTITDGCPWHLGAGWALWDTGSSAPCCKSQPPIPKTCPFGPKPSMGKPPQCLQQLLLTGSVGVRLCFGPLRGQKWPLSMGEGAVLCCAVQPACAFSCSALKYPLVSFLTSYSLYPKLCISPLNGVIFLIAGRALLLDTSLLLVHCVVLQRAPGTHLILQTARRESSCSSAASAHPKRSLLPIRLIAETPTPGRSWLGAALQPLYPTEEWGSAARWGLPAACTAKSQPCCGKNLTSCTTAGTRGGNPSQGKKAHADME